MKTSLLFFFGAFFLCMGTDGAHAATLTPGCRTIGQSCKTYTDLVYNPSFGDSADDAIGSTISRPSTSLEIQIATLCCDGLSCINGRCAGSISCGTEGNICGPSGVQCCNGYQCTNNICEKCTGCDPKEDPTTEWRTDPKTFIRTRTFGVCICNTWKKIVESKCETGYYGNPLSGGISTPNPCTKCPTVDGTDIPSTTSGPGATKITDCYVPQGTTGQDETGKFRFNIKCNYVNP